MSLKMPLYVSFISRIPPYMLGAYSEIYFVITRYFKKMMDVFFLGEAIA